MSKFDKAVDKGPGAVFGYIVWRLFLVFLVVSMLGGIIVSNCKLGFAPLSKA